MASGFSQVHPDGTPGACSVQVSVVGELCHREVSGSLVFFARTVAT